MIVRRLFSVALVATLALVQTRADEPDTATAPILSLGDMIVVATTHARELFDTPYSTESLDDLDLTLRLQPRSMAEGLKGNPGVLLQKTAHGQVSPYLRGVTSQRVVLVADGVRLNNSYLREGPNEYWGLVDAYYYDNMEALYGPASVLYGSDAIGGAVSVTSDVLPRGAAGSGLQWAGGEALFRYSSAEQSFSEHLQGAATIGDRVTLSLGLTRRDFGDLTGGEGEHYANTSFEEQFANLRLQVWLTDNQWLTFGYDHADRDDINRQHRTVDHVDFYGTRSKGSTGDRHRLYDYDTRRAFAAWHLREGDGFIQEADLTVSYQYFDEIYRRLRTDGRRSFREAEIDTVGIDLRLQSDSAWGTWTYGADWYHDDVDTVGIDWNAANVQKTLIQGNVADDASYDLFGIYLQNEAELSSRFELITGLRYSYARLQADKVDFHDGTGTPGSLDADYQALTGSARLLFHAIPDRLNTFVGISQGFRAPNLSDATRDDEFGGGVERPTANLDPEQFTTVEIGAKLRGDRGYLQVVAYHTEIRDRIARLSTPTTKRNLDSGYIHGIEVDGRLVVTDAISLFGAVAWQEGEEENYVDLDLSMGTGDYPMSRMLPISGNAGIHYEPAGAPWWLEGLVEAAAQQEDYAQSEVGDNRFPPDGTPSYIVGHLRAGWAIRDNVDWVVELQNITDERYRIHGSGTNEPGRGLVTSVRFTF